MRCTVVLALGLALFAVAQAQLDPKVLLEGLPSEDDVIALNGHHWRRHGPPHDSNDHHYWEKRHSVKASLIRCLERAAESFDKKNPTTWEPAGEAAAKCFLEHLGGCHDAPGIAEEVTKTLPWLLFVSGLKTLAANGVSGLAHAEAVLEFYYIGSVQPTLIQPNPFYTGPTGCASRLANLLQSGCHSAKDTQTIWALAKIVAKLIESADNGWGPYADCVSDIPAVIISLVSTQCTETGVLFNPFNPAAPILCNPPAPTATFEGSAGALLGGSIYTLLLLSGKPKLEALGVQVGFAINRQALGATQTTSFPACMDSTPADFPANIDYRGQLWNGIQAIPIYSGAVPTSPTTFSQAETPLTISPDGQRVICASIAMMSGGYGNVPGPLASNWANNLLWQGSANTANAVFKTIALNPTAVRLDQVTGLCAVGRAIWRFTDVKPITPTTPTVVTIPGASSPPEVNAACFTDSVEDNCVRPLPFFSTVANPAAGIEPHLAQGHDLSSASWIGQFCWK